MNQARTILAYFLVPRDCSIMEEKKEDGKQLATINDFYNWAQEIMTEADKQYHFCYITSYSTTDNVIAIETICTRILQLCKDCLIPTEGVFLRKTDASVKAFKYLVCNTNFNCQSLLADDIVNGYLVDMQQPFSTFLFIQILWYIHFEDILAESMLHFPLDLCVEILEILLRCVDLLDFPRASKFLTTLIPNVYKKLIITRDTGSQSKDLNENAKKLAGNLQELILQFNNERLLRYGDISTPNKYKRQGTLLKGLIQMVRMCLTSKSVKTEVPVEMELMYKLTFGREPLETIDNSVFEELLIEIDRELVNLLLKKVKEIDCNIYLNWTEFDDEDNTSLTLQRAIGLECYFFIENTKQFKESKIKEYNHLVDCLQQIASKPDPGNDTESLQMEDLSHGVSEKRKDCLIALFKRYKEWDNSSIDSIDSNIELLKKDDCEELFEYLAGELSQPLEHVNTENLQIYALCLAKALVYLKITELYEITIKFTLKFSENDNLENVIDITNFERFIMHNPNISTAKNLRVVLFFLCLKTRLTLKILLKMAIGHFDYPDVAISLDDLALLLPILKIQTQRKYGNMIEALKIKCTEQEEGFQMHKLEKAEPKMVDTEYVSPKSISLAVRLLQEICLEGPGWEANKFASLLQMLYSFCKVSEVVNEVFIPFLMSDACTLTYLKYTLVELHKLIGKYDEGISVDLIRALDKQGLYLSKSNHISRYVVDEMLSLIIQLKEHLRTSLIKNFIVPDSAYHEIFLPCANGRSLRVNINRYLNLYQVRIFENMLKYPIALIQEDMIRHLFLRCTKKQYLLHIEEIISSYSKDLKWPNLLNISNNLIRLTIETCLLCLEYPGIAAPDSIGFLLRCLIQYLSTMNGNKKFFRGVCESLDNHTAILKSSIQYTAILDAYNELLKRCQESQSSFNIYLNAFESFASICMLENEKLRAYEGPHSPLGIKLWLAYDVVNELLEESVENEEYLNKLDEYFKPKE